MYRYRSFERKPKREDNITARNPGLGRQTVSAAVPPRTTGAIASASRLTTGRAPGLRDGVPVPERGLHLAADEG